MSKLIIDTEDLKEVIITLSGIDIYKVESMIRVLKLISQNKEECASTISTST